MKPPVEDSRQRRISHPLVLTRLAFPTPTFVVSGTMRARVGYVALPTMQLSHDYDDGFRHKISQLTLAADFIILSFLQILPRCTNGRRAVIHNFEDISSPGFYML